VPAVWLYFTVEKDGSITNIHTSNTDKKSSAEDIEKATRILLENTKCEPGIDSYGNPVRCQASERVIL